MDQNTHQAIEPTPVEVLRQAAQAAVPPEFQDEDNSEQVSALGHDMETVCDRQKHYFLSGATRSYQFRRQQLLRLKQMIKIHEDKLKNALLQDLGKSRIHAFATEIGMVHKEINYQLKHLKAMMKPIKVGTPLVAGMGKSRIFRQPKGQVLIISPWNYPVLLFLSPLVGAIAAGNTVVLKPSELASASSKALARLIEMTFDERHVAVFEGGAIMTQSLLKYSWDHIFFTGSTRVGRIVAEAGAKHLTPVTLELGGKSPCILSRNANIEIAIRRIVWGKFVNAGQTCVAPDYLLVDDAIHEQVIVQLQKEIVLRYGNDPQKSTDLGRIINYQHFQRLTAYIKHDPSKVCHGGQYNAEDRFIAPTILDGVDFRHPVMTEEVFGPILPIIRYSSLEQVIRSLQDGAKPLALYMFTEDKAEMERVIQNVTFGGGCINDTLMHLVNPSLPFGGVRESGIGAYHGRDSFETFSHRKGILISSTAIDPVIRYAPMTSWKEKIFRLLMT